MIFSVLMSSGDQSNLLVLMSCFVVGNFSTLDSLHLFLSLYVFLLGFGYFYVLTFFRILYCINQKYQKYVQYFN